MRAMVSLSIGLALLALSSATEHTHRYLIVGSGPGSLQMAHYLQSAGRDYVVLEAGPKASDFFRKFPAFRELISLNKRHVGTDLLDLNLRHDWNSLLSDPSPSHPDAILSSSDNSSRLGSLSDPKLLFREWDQTLWPSADRLVDYLDYYVQAQKLNIKYNAAVWSVKKLPDESFEVTTSSGDLYKATFVLVGTGLGVPVEPNTTIVGGEFEHYRNASLDKHDYEGHRVLVLGRGNAAFEFASNIMDSTQYVHILAKYGRIRLAWESHYPGGVRTIHNQLLETYMLKSMDIMWEVDFSETEFKKDPNDGLWYVYVHDDSQEEDEDGHQGNKTGIGRPSEHGYHNIVSCLGWNFNSSMFEHGGIELQRTPNGKYPAMNGRFEAKGHKNLFFLGTLMHSRDYRKASGGFIHGFRYLARSLHRHMEQWFEPDGASWPMRKISTSRDDVGAVADACLWRIDHASGPYQMFGYLADVILLVYKGDQFWTEYREEVPVGILDYSARTWCEQAEADACSFVALTLEYGQPPPKEVQKQLYDLGAVKDPFGDKRVGETGETSHFLHPILRLRTLESNNKFKLRSTMQLTEHPLTEWTAIETVPVGHFFAAAINVRGACNASTKKCAPGEEIPEIFIHSPEGQDDEAGEDNSDDENGQHDDQLDEQPDNPEHENKEAEKAGSRGQKTETA